MPAMCQNCGQRPAAYHTIRNIQGVVTERYLCRECHEQLIYESKLSSIADYVNAINASAFPQQARFVKCPTCGTSLQQFKETLFVGCADCYKAFESIMSQMLRSVQGSVMHKGRIAPTSDTPVDERAQLEEELKRAVAEERYEDAIVLRERIRALDGGQN